MNILGIEGQFNLPLVEDLLLKPLAKLYMNSFTYQTMAWDGTRPQGQFDIVIGHSLGGHRAIELSRYYPKLAYVTLDPRWMSNWGWTDWLYPWMKDFSVASGMRFYNFYHVGLMSGYKVDGATNTKLNCGHLQIPGQPEVFSLVEGLIKN